MRELFARDASARAREAALTMAAVLLSFGSAYGLKRAEGVSASVEVLAVALALSLSRVAARAEHRSLRARVQGLMALPFVAVGASEIGTLLFEHPDLGDTLFVLAVVSTVWVRRFGERVRRLATFAVLPVISVLIVPGVAVAGGSGDASRWFSALVAVIALAWVTLIRLAFQAEDAAAVVVPARAAPRRPRAGESRIRLLGSTRMAIQMGVALAGAFALGRWLFAPHWSWCVLSAFIVSSGNRGREDVAHKAAMRVIGAGVGTLGATLIAGAFAPGDAWSIVVIFGLLGIALWLRPLNYAFWAAGMTAALALLYGYYGEAGVSMLGPRLEAILIGAGLGLAAAWLLWPIRTGDVIRRDIGAALAALDRLLAALVEDPEAIPARRHGFQRTVATLQHHRELLSAIPRPLRRRIDHLPALQGLERVGACVGTGIGPDVDGGGVDVAVCTDPEAVGGLRGHIEALRGANARAQLPDPVAWGALADGIAALAEPTASSSALL